MTSSIANVSFNQSQPGIINWPVKIAVAATRLLIAGGILAGVFALFDDPQVITQDARVNNLRLGLWLFIVELLVDAYRTTYTTPDGFPGTVRLAIKESLLAALTAVWLTPLSLLLRATVIVLFTWLLLLIGGPAWLPSVAALLPTIGKPILRKWLATKAKIPTNPHIRGTHLGSYMEAVAKAAALTVCTQNKAAQQVLAAPQSLRPQLQLWADRVTTPVHFGVDLPLLVMDPHYLLLGVAGTGKTLMMRLLMQSVLVREGRLMSRAVVYDAKRDFYPLLLGMGVPADAINIMNPADARSVGWDIASDIENKDDAHSIAIALIPQADGNARDHTFFVQAAQAITTGVMWTLHCRSPGNWDLNDVLQAVSTPDSLKTFFLGDPEGSATYQRYFTDAAETVGGIVSTLDTKLITPYESIARLWARGGRRISLKKWASSPNPSILILGSDTNRAAVNNINRAMFSRMVQLITSKTEHPHDPNHHTDTTWFFLDEMRFAGELPLLGDLISLGRSKGARVVMAAQDIDGLYAAYGQHKGDELLALCGNVAVFRLMSPKTRDWATKLFGEYEAWEEDYSNSKTITGGWLFGDRSKTDTTNHKKVKKESILPSEFFDLPKAGPGSGLPGFFATPEVGAWRGPIPWDYVRQHLTDGDGSTPGFVPRPPQDYAALPGTSPAGVFPTPPTPPTSPTPPTTPNTPSGHPAPASPPPGNPAPGTPTPSAPPAQTPPASPPPAQKRPGRLPW